ncbi:MAG: aminotransferase class I/II-fold pyridoxal phosphate-dependent enzyme [Rhodospirillaceae bacterium]|nr:MAG: aminotransferase class I/II-fold pyridoxal phosphate-dependent enzyme [Rhodospirillaceae bacterium]
MRMYNTRLDGLTEYPFQRLAALLAGVEPPRGQTPMIMSIGEPQHKAPDLLLSALGAAAGDWGKYPPNAGTADYRTAVTGWCNARYGLPSGFLDSERHVLPVAGSREGLFMAAQLCVPPTKNGAAPTVLMPSPFYQVYFGAAVMNGATPVFVAATRETGFLPDYAAVARRHLANAAMAYLCTPANPQGTVANLEQLKAAITLARTHDFVLVSDECYSEIYDTVPPAGALQACAALGDGLRNVLVFNSLSKRSSVPGLRAGFVAGDADLIAKFKILRAHGGAVQPMPVMSAATALWRDETHVTANRALYRAKFDDAAQVFGNRFGFYRPAGGFFLWLDVGDGERAAKILWRDAAIKVLPGAYLAVPDAAGRNPGAPYIRVAVVHEREVATSALRRMKQVLETL